MKLYMHPASTTSRPILLFIADHRLEVAQQVVNIKAGEQHEAWFAAVNPNHLVPVLEDGEFRLTEGSAILKYLADKISSPTYPTELCARARVNEAMDWFNTNFCRTFAYGLCYAQLIEGYKLPDKAAQEQAVAAGKRGAERFLRVLDEHLLGPNRKWICGDEITLADYLGSGMVSLGNAIGCTFAAYPSLARWYGHMRARPNWETANAGIAAWAKMARGPAYVTV